ncbi:MAG: hypothetical protein A2W93_15670 [Bacteroidetes bacterium GWF2_43_63]|nr:MAG: hypothetical protein A2W94_13720 [Bacteroidetes bacterium GWE2_42_42]OFY53108.1 MAG: hypothetical protein A2W93_15670 [Bacteroidetes bacterium GWF2_43_63]HBG70380.1 hypothetical protein [Bacteroidales bacterium]HCB60573.1 hypothetical protein [Bacteroidales bacterium]HCY22942.1 hypothetical protein [Bacteroidales bacterium]
MRHHVIVIVGFIALHLFAGNATAQITLSASNTPKAEYKYTFQKIQFNYSDLFHAGADTVWDISGAVFTGDSSTIHYTQDTAFDPFPGCCMTNELHDYLNNLDNSFLQVNGYVYQITDTAFIIAYERRSDQYTSCFVMDDKSYPIISFPFGYGSINERHDNMQEKTIAWQKEGDAWGSLICPDTTYQNVLRIKTTDSTFYQPIPNHPGAAGGNSVKYEWYNADSDVPVLSLSFNYWYYWDSVSDYWGRDTTALLYQSKTYLPLDTPFHVIVPENSIVLYPNPATNTIAIEGNDSISELVIYNTSGYAVMHFNQITAGKKVRVNISTLSKGLYIAAGKFTSEVSFRKKFIVTED